jgi:hypothetical protein
VQPLERVLSKGIVGLNHKGLPVAPGPVLGSFGIDPAADAQLTLLDFDLVVFAFFGLAARTIAGRQLCIFSQLLRIPITLCVLDGIRRWKAAWRGSASGLLRAQSALLEIPGVSSTRRGVDRS